MAAGTFSVTMDPHELVGVDPDASGKLTIRFQGGATHATVAGDLVALDEFSRRAPYAVSVSAGYTVELPTDVASGGDPDDSAVGYDLTWFNGEATVRALFVGQPDGATVLLSDLAPQEAIPLAVSEANAERAEDAATAAAASAAAAATFDPATTAPGIRVTPGASASANVTALQAAFDAGASSGRVVHPVGAFPINAPIDISDGARIDGKNATITQTADLTAAIDTNSATDVQISGLTIYGKHTDYTDASGVYAASAVTITGTSSDVHIKDCQFLDWAGAGVQVASTVTGPVTVRDCTMTGAAAEVAAARTAQGPTAEVNYSAGVRCLSEQPIEVRGCDISGFAQGIVTAKDATDVRIIGNFIHNISDGQHGAYLSLMAGRLVFTDNVITDCYDCGMKVQIADPTGTASADIVISDNVITATGGQGIMLTNIETVAPESLVLSKRFAIVGNVLTDNTRGIQVNDCENGVVALNVISDGRGNGTGINVEDSTGLTIVDNRITNVPLYGIRLTAVTKSRVDRNTLTNVSTANTSSNNFGIHVVGVCSDLDFADNHITDANATMLYGFYFNPTSGLDSFAVRGNRVVGTHASGYGARFASATAIREYRGNDFNGVTNRVLNPPTSALGRPGREYLGSAAPTTPTGTGAYRVGDIVWNTAPAASGTMGWVCTTASSSGNAGTWKTFGAISA